MAFPADPLDVTVELFYSAAWQDITAYTYTRDDVQISRGAPDEAAHADPSELALTLNNRDGRFSPRNPRSPLFGLIGRNTPIRVTVEGSVRFVGEVSEWPPLWNVGGFDVWVPLRAAGISRRLGQGQDVLSSPLFHFYDAYNSTLVAYLPLEDGPDSALGSSAVPAASAVRYGAPLPEFGQDDTCPGSAPLPTWPVVAYFGWSAGASVAAHSPPWQVHVTFRVPTAAVGRAGYLCEWRTTGGTFNTWELRFNTSGELLVVAIDDVTPQTLTHTATDVGSVVDGQWHTAVVVVEQQPSSTQAVTILANGLAQRFVFGFTTVGSVAQVRPRPMYVSVSGGEEPIGLGHMAVIASDAIGDVLNVVPATSGHSGEHAEDRHARLCTQHGITAEVVTPSTAASVRDASATSSSATTFTVPVPTNEAGDGLLVVHQGSLNTPATLPAPDADAAWVLLLRGARFNIWWRYARATEPATFAMSQDPVEDSSVVVVAVANARKTPPVVPYPMFTVTTTGGITPSSAPAGHQDLDLRIVFTSNAQVGSFTPPTGYTLEAEVLTIVSAAVASKQLASPAVTGQQTVVCATSASIDGITVTVPSDATSARLGPQRRINLLEMFRDGASADLGLLYETRDLLGLTYRTRATLYNQDPSLELSYDGAGELSPPLQPTEDDQLTRNDVTVNRVGNAGDGGTGRAILEQGPLSVEAIGRYTDSVDVNVEMDSDLPDQASWRLHLGTVDEFRWPQIHLNLAAMGKAGKSALLAAAAALDVGNRLTIDGLPAWVPPDLVQQHALGFAETLGSFGWDITVNGAPCSPYHIAEVEHADYGMLLSDSAVTAEALDTTETGVDINAGAGPDWVYEADFDVMIGGERMTVTAVAAMAGTFPNRTTTLTVTRSVNSIAKAHATGAGVEFFHKSFVGL
jgi:hypothetical protein